jgi:hypothetical protein
MRSEDPGPRILPDESTDLLILGKSILQENWMRYYKWHLELKTRSSCHKKKAHHEWFYVQKLIISKKSTTLTRRNLRSLRQLQS